MPIEPCDIPFAGRMVSDFCERCGHGLLAHRQDRVCSVCEVVAEVRTAERQRQRMAEGHWPTCDYVMYCDDENVTCNIDCEENPSGHTVDPPSARPRCPSHPRRRSAAAVDGPRQRQIGWADKEGRWIGPMDSKYGVSYEDRPVFVGREITDD